MDNTSSVLPNATSFSVVVNVPKNELSEKFEQFWTQVKDRLSPDIVTKAKRGGYRSVKRERVEKVAGGKAEFYRPVLIEYVSGYLNNQEKQAISYNDIVLDESSDTGTIKANVYLEPSVTWKKKPGIDSPIVVTIDKVPDNLTETLVSDELHRTRQNSATFTDEPAEATVQIGSAITLDCTTKVDGSVWEPATFKNNRWVVEPAVFSVQGIAEQLVGLKAGETKTFTITYPADIQTVGGKQAEVTVSVLKVLKANIPGLDDQFAVSNGFESLAKWTEALTTKYKNMIEEETRNTVITRAVDQIVSTDTVEVEPVPAIWTAQKARQVYGWQRDMYKTEEDLINAYSKYRLSNGMPVTDRNSLLWYFGENTTAELVSSLVLRSWGKLAGVEGDTSLSNIEAYVDGVRDHLFKTVTVEQKPRTQE